MSVHLHLKVCIHPLVGTVSTISLLSLELAITASTFSSDVAIIFCPVATLPVSVLLVVGGWYGGNSLYKTKLIDSGTQRLSLKDGTFCGVTNQQC